MEGTIGEVRMFAGTFAPRSWAFCHGQLLPISQNTALFSILGTTYGGDGRTTFGLPDLRGRVPLGVGRGPGLTDRRLGSRSGEENHTLSVNEIPSHGHQVRCRNEEGNSNDPTGNVPAKPSIETDQYSSEAATQSMSGGSVANAGGGSQHNNMQPWLGMNYIICLQGVFPSRS